MAKAKNETYGAMDGFFNEPEQTERKINPESLKNLKPREAGSAQPKAYMQLNIYDYEDYIYRMAKVQGKTMTAYVLDLIQKDKEQNQQAYEGLKLIKELDKPARKPKNTKKLKINIQNRRATPCMR